MFSFTNFILSTNLTEEMTRLRFWNNAPPCWENRSFPLISLLSQSHIGDWKGFGVSSVSWGMIEYADCRNYMSTRHTTASRCQVCVRPHLSAVKTRRLNAPLCLNLSCWLYGNDASQAKHNKPLASSARRQRRWEDGNLTSVCVSQTNTGNAD